MRPKLVVAPSLSQVQESVERPTAFASGQMNKDEQNYSAAQAVMLAVIWSTKQYFVTTLKNDLQLERIIQH
jgi:hypothetical protein